MLWSYVRHLAFILIMTNLRLFLSIFFDEIFSHNCKKKKKSKEVPTLWTKFKTTTSAPGTLCQCLSIELLNIHVEGEF